MTETPPTYVQPHSAIVDEAEEVFTFDVISKPSLINVDADKILLCEKEDNKTTENFIYQYYHAPLFLDRYEAVNHFIMVQEEDTAAQKTLL